MTQAITSEQILSFRKDGAVMIPGLFSHLVGALCEGVAENMANPGPYAAENVSEGHTGRFFDDYCNWNRIAPFEAAAKDPVVAAAAAQLMGSKTVQLFHEHVLVKAPGTSKPTPWHQDSPYYFVEGEQTISFWVPLDPVTNATLRCVRGSHLWEKPVLPTRWLKEDGFYADSSAYQPVPDPDAAPGALPDASNMEIAEWAMQPGDAVAFHFRTLHGAKGNESQAQRRAFSLRVVGDDARYVQRPGKTSPPFPGHNMQPGDRLREDWFPVIYSQT